VVSVTTHPDLRPVTGFGPWPPGRSASTTGRWAKLLVDRLGAALLVLLLAPLMLGIALAIRCDDRGPVLTRRTMVGRQGRPFVLLGFRTTGVEAGRTRVGAVLRRCSLDGLPQLFNVLVGQMSLVGPRPLAPGEVARFGPDARRRLLVRPGLTGVWQLNGHGGPSRHLSWAEAARLDLRYVEDWRPGLDVRILSRSVTAALNGRGDDADEGPTGG
jgi:lipopolysaccharide/colanic/teichoic acid biosynthesis glycosyltransferase